MHSPAIRTSVTFFRPSHFKPSTVALLFIALIVVAAIPVLTHALPPLSDYVNHLGRTYAITHIDTDADLARYYTVKWQLVPNLMIDLAVLALNPFMDVYHAGQVFTITAFVLTLSGVLVLNRTLFGSWSPLPLIAAPLLYNEVMLVGVLNYMFGMGLTLWAIAAWAALRDRPWPWRFAVSTAFALVLYFCHLYAVGLYGIAVMAFEVQRMLAQRGTPVLQRLLTFVAAGLPFVPVVVLLSGSPTWGAVSEYMWMLAGKLDGLAFAVNVYYPAVAVGLVGVTLAAAAWAVWMRLLRVHPLFWPVLVIGGVVYLAMPRSLFGAFMADQRLPIALAFVLIACMHVEFRERRMRQALVTMVILLLAVRVIEVQFVWDRLAPISEEFLRSVAMIDRGARVLVVHADRSASPLISDYGVVHAASLAMIERSALVSTTFTVKGKQVLRARSEYRNYVETEDRTPPSIYYFLDAAHHAGPYFFNEWPRHYDYVYILFTRHGAANPDPADMKQIYDGSNFQLFRVVNPG